MKPNDTAPKPGDPLAAALRAVLQDVVRQAVRDAVVEVLAELRDDPPRPALLTIDQLCQQLSCSRSMLQKLRAEGMPVLMFGDSPRVELAAVLAWLREREP